MRQALVVFLLMLAGAACGPSAPPDYPVAAVPLARVRLTDGFWRGRADVNRTVTIRHIMVQNEATGRVANFLKAAGKLEGAYEGQRYNDTDVYKVIEAASRALATSPDSMLDQRLDALIAIVGAAQEPDGYLYTPRSVDPDNPPPGAGPERWSYLHTSHELYNAGHLYEAAVAHFDATGKRTLLDIAIRNADLVCEVFGPGKRLETSGHEEIELALVKLYRATGDRKYLDQAKFFLDQRGRAHTVAPVEFARGDRFFMYNDRSYRQDHLPILEQPRAVGHAVRATYMYIGMTDVAELLGAGDYGRKADALWDDVTSKRVYVTGGLGSEGRTEAFGDDYVLPNRAYAETCASIGGMLWYHRMFRRKGDATYLDMFERTLYNGYLSGVSLAGNTFFYQNPLVSDGGRERQPYFDVACCPANFARMMAELPGLIYARTDDEIYVNLFIGSEATIDAGGTTVRVAQQTRYPWDGAVAITVDPEEPASLALAVRVPGWSRGEVAPGGLYRFADAPSSPAGAGFSWPDAAGAVNRPVSEPELRVNGESVSLDLDRGFVVIRRRWQKGDRVELTLPMPARRVLADERVEEDRGKAAIARGPIIYAVEGIDNGGSVTGLRVPLDARLETAFRDDLLDGVEIVTGTAFVTGEDGRLAERPFVAVPYYAWGNRGSGVMAVWIPR